jgi:hypothetical protein
MNVHNKLECCPWQDSPNVFVQGWGTNLGYLNLKYLTVSEKRFT